MFCLIRKFDTNIRSTVLLLIVFLLDHKQFANSQGKQFELVKRLALANNDFALSIFDILSTAHGNEVISPISLLSAFGILYNGAGKTTCTDLGEFLKFSDNKLDDNGVKESFKFLYNSLMKKNDKIEFNMFNAVLSQLSLELKPEFQLMAKTYYNAKMIIDNFKVTSSLTESINQMIKRQTNDKIERLIDSNLDPQTQLMIFNVVYFRGLWHTEFKEKDTKNQVFWNSKNEKEKVKMMAIYNKQFNYIKAPGVLDAEILELPYVGKTFSLVIMLPRERQGLVRLKLNFNTNHITTVLRQMVPTKVDLFLPKFKFSSKYSMKNLLKEGIGQQLFDTGADFSRMTAQKNMVLNEILHKVVIEVNENGTEAAAATGVGLVSRSMENPNVQFRADHPFLYFINDRRTGMMLFLGQVSHLTDYDEDIAAKAKQIRQEVAESEQADPEINDEIIEKMKKIRYGLEHFDE